jgi:hypothetical protein
MMGRELMRLELLPNDYGRAGKQKKEDVSPTTGDKEMTFFNHFETRRRRRLNLRQDVTSPTLLSLLNLEMNYFWFLFSFYS